MEPSVWRLRSSLFVTVFACGVLVAPWAVAAGTALDQTNLQATQLGSRLAGLDDQIAGLEQAMDSESHALQSIDLALGQLRVVGIFGHSTTGRERDLLDQRANLVEQMQVDTQTRLELKKQSDEAWPALYELRDRMAVQQREQATADRKVAIRQQQADAAARTAAAPPAPSPVAAPSAGVGGCANLQVTPAYDFVESGAGQAAPQAAASCNSASPAPSMGQVLWPVDAPITSPFGMRWGHLHSGIDLGAASGTPIIAAAAGVVTTAGAEGGYGNLVVIDHGAGFSTAYAHQSQIATTVGQVVTAGQVIGFVGNTGHSFGPHLHFETRVNGIAFDPIGFLPPRAS